MNTLFSKLSPTITNMIRMDHTHVMVTFHKFQADTALSTKEALVDIVCTALEVHAQLEEEIFYPALRSVAAGNEVLDKSVPEHDEMRRLIASLRDMMPTDPSYDQTFMALMRDVMHHVADEESTLLPEAERLLADQLHDLGARMTKRRLELIAPRAGKMALSTIKAAPASTLLMTAGGLLAGGYLIKRAMDRRV